MELASSLGMSPFTEPQVTERRTDWTLLQVLDWTKEHFAAKDLNQPRLDAEVLLAHVLKTQRIMLYAHHDRPMSPPELEQMRALVARRAGGEPIAHLLGFKEFWSIPIEVNPHVLVPRPETELLIEVILERAPNLQRAADVGTGSGAIALALAKEAPSAALWGLEKSEKALEVAYRNGQDFPNVEFVRSDLLTGLPKQAQPLDVVAANLPYIPTASLSELPPEVKNFDPRMALDGGEDGLQLIRGLIQQSPPVLREGGLIALESGPEQTEAIRWELRQTGFKDVDTRVDLAGLPRISSGLWLP